MDNIERRDREMAYISDRAVMEEQKRTRKIPKASTWDKT